MTKMRMLVAVLGIGVLAAFGCSSSSSGNRSTIPRPAEPENFNDRTPVRGSDMGQPADAHGLPEDPVDAPNDMKKGSNKHDDGAPTEDESDENGLMNPDSGGGGGS